MEEKNDNAEKEANWVDVHRTRQFLSMQTPADLCRLLRKPFNDLEQMINHPVYHGFSVPKKRGGCREIVAPSVELKRVQRRLNHYLQFCYLYIRPAEVHGFVIHPKHLQEPCNIVVNANQHTGKKQLLNIDLKEFFPGIAAQRVKEVFHSSCFSFSDQVANALTLLTTLQGKLPTGAPTSPVISNFICYGLDYDLITFCENRHLTYSRYADDLTFSSNDPINPSITDEIITLVERHGFEVNRKKTRLTSSYRKQTVTGITVNEKVNVDRNLLKKTRAMLHDLSLNGAELATRRHFNIRSEVTPELISTFISRLTGYINFTGQVRGPEDYMYLKFKEQLTNNT
jgi:RNA-directed DNA polymerase